MKYRLLLLSIAACLSAADAPPVEVELANPSFEKVDDETGLPTGWHGSAGVVLVSDDIVASDGERSLGAIFCGGQQDLYWTSESKPDGKTAAYRITADVRMQEYDGQFRIQGYTYTASSRGKFEVTLKSDQAEDGWQQVSLDVRPKEIPSRLTIAIFARGTWGRLWVDNVRVQRLEDE